MDNINKWYNNYIKNIDLKKIEWIKLNSSELADFFDNNYYDKEVCEYVYDQNANSLHPTLLGMSYLNFNSSRYVNYKKQQYSFLLGIANNTIDKKTVVAATIYLDEYFIFTDQEIPVTYISTMEVNSYFRNRGIYKMMCEELFKHINHEQHIVTSTQSDMGLKCNTFNTLKEKLMCMGFQNRIFEDNDGLIKSELYNIICSRQKVLTKTKKK